MGKSKKNSGKKKGAEVRPEAMASVGAPQAPAATTGSLKDLPDLPLLQETGAQRRLMPVSTAILGMTLTLVLGMILGAVLPPMLEQRQIRLLPQVTTTTRAPSIPQASASQPPAAPPELLHKIEHLEKDLAASPGERALYVALGNACFDANLHDRAIQAYEKALAMDPNDADVLTDLGIMYREKGAYNDSLDRFRRAQSLNPAHTNAIFNEGIVLIYDLDRKDDGLKCWQRVLNADPQAKTPNGRPLADLIKELQGS